MPNLRRLPIHRKTLHDARAQSQGIKPLINSPIFFNIKMVEKITFYYHPMCEGCLEVKPLVKEFAQIKGWDYNEVNIDDCTTKICEEMEYVPTIYIDGKKLDFEEMDELLSGKLD